MSDFDMTATPALVQQEQNLSPRRRELSWRLDFSTIPDGTGLAAGETMDFGVVPAGFVLEQTVAILRTAEGGAATLDIGITGNEDALLDGGDVNGTPAASIALAGTEAITAGHYFGSDTTIVAEAVATIDAAILDFKLIGFMVETS